MKFTIEKTGKGFRARWHDGRGAQDRATFESEIELKEWLARFDFAQVRALSSDDFAARSFASPAPVAEPTRGRKHD